MEIRVIYKNTLHKNKIYTVKHELTLLQISDTVHVICY